MFGRRRDAVPPPPVSGLTRDHVIWAYRLILDRDPESEAVIEPKLAGSRTTADLRRHLMTSAEFHDKNPDYARTNESTVVIKELRGPGSVRLFVDLSDHVIGLGILRGQYEQAEADYVTRTLRPGDSAIDVGGHVGFFTMLMADRVGTDGRVVVFEPFDQNADLLTRSIEENEFGERVTVHRAAVGAAAGTATLTFPVETLNTGGAYLVPDGGTAPAGNRTREVPVVTLDELLTSGLKRPVRLIKMDVEGAEPQVVGGAERLLREDRPVILSELHTDQLRRASGVSAEDFLTLLRRQGYDAYRLDATGPGARIEGPPDAPVTSVVFLSR